MMNSKTEMKQKQKEEFEMKNFKSTLELKKKKEGFKMENLNIKLKSKEKEESIMEKLKYLRRHGKRTLPMYISETLAWVNGRLVDIEGLIPQYIVDRRASADYYKDGVLVSQEKWAPSRIAIVSTPSWSWDYFNKFEYVIKEVVVLLTEESLRRIKNNMFDEINEAGQVVKYNYLTYAKIAKFAAEKGIPFSVQVGNRKVRMKSGGSLADCVRFNYPEVGTPYYWLINKKWFSLYRYGIANAFPIGVWSIRRLQTLEWVLTKYPEMFKTARVAGFYNKVKDGSVDYIVWEYADVVNKLALKEYRELFKALDTRKKNQIMQDMLKKMIKILVEANKESQKVQEGILNDYLIIKNNWVYAKRDFAKVAKPMVRLIKKYFDVDLIVPVDERESEITTEEKVLLLYARIINELPKWVVIDYIKEMSIEAWDDREAEVLGISWAKKVKTKTTWADVELYGSMSVLDYNIRKDKKKRGDDEE